MSSQITIGKSGGGSFPLIQVFDSLSRAVGSYFDLLGERERTDQARLELSREKARIDGVLRALEIESNKALQLAQARLAACVNEHRTRRAAIAELGKLSCKLMSQLSKIAHLPGSQGEREMIGTLLVEVTRQVSSVASAPSLLPEQAKGLEVDR